MYLLQWIGFRVHGFQVAEDERTCCDAGGAVDRKPIEAEIIPYEATHCQLSSKQ